MTDSLIDQLDATLRTLNDLGEQREQAQLYERAITRLRYLTPSFATLVEELRRLRASLPGDSWAQLCVALTRERPADLEAVGQTLLADDERFMCLVSYTGFVRGALVALSGEIAPRE